MRIPTCTNNNIGETRKMKKISMFFEILIKSLILAGSTQGSQFRADYKYYPEAHGWIKFHRVPAHWSEARFRCHVEGAVIASPIHEGLYVAMRSLMRTQTESVFTGVHADAQDLYSFEGVPVDQMPIQWAKGEPNNVDNGERCTSILPDGTFADVKCTTVRSFMCYKEKTGNETMSPDCGTYASGYKYVKSTGSCYKFHSDCVHWWRANMICASEGGHMVILNSADEAQVLHDMYATSPIRCDGERNPNAKRFVHVGFHNLDLDRAFWFTIDGKRIEDEGYYGVWAAGQPNNDHEQCGSLTRANVGLNDINCSDNIPFICEITNPKGR